MNNIYLGRSSFDYGNKLPSKYLESIKDLSIQLNSFKEINGKIQVPSFETQSYHLQSFVEKYTAIPPVWNAWYQWTMEREYNFNENFTIERRCRKVLDKQISIPKYLHGPQELIKLSEKHFPQNGRFEWPFYNDYKLTLKWGSLAEKQRTASFLLQYPTSKLSVAFEIYKETLDGPISKDSVKIYEENCKIYKNIQSSVKDIKKWIEALWETKNIEFVVQNIECRLAKEPWNWKVWLCYIDFLEINDIKETTYIFDMYSRYCRLFLEDKKMKEKYQKKVEEKSRSSFDGISKFWIDLIKFEFNFNSIESAALLLHKGLAITEMANPIEFYEFALEFVECHGLKELKNEGDLVRKAYVEAHVSVNPVKYSLNRIANAAFSKKPVEPILPFGSLVNKYLWNNFGYKHLPKLYQTCKYFYYKYRVHFVNNLDISDSTILASNSVDLIQEKLIFHKQNISVSPYYRTRDKLNNLWITGALKCPTWDGFFQLADKIIECNLKYVFLCSTILTLEQYNMLIKDAEVLILKYIRVLQETVKSNHETHWMFQNYVNPTSLGHANIEKLLEKALKVKILSIDSFFHDENSAEKLMALEFDNKFSYFGLRAYQNFNFEPRMLCAFLEKNIAPHAVIALYNYADLEWAIPKLSEIKNELLLWESSSIKKPEIRCSVKHILG